MQLYETDKTILYLFLWKICVKCEQWFKRNRNEFYSFQIEIECHNSADYLKVLCCDSCSFYQSSLRCDAFHLLQTRANFFEYMYVLAQSTASLSNFAFVLKKITGTKVFSSYVCVAKNTVVMFVILFTFAIYPVISMFMLFI